MCDDRVPERETFWLLERNVSPPQYVSGFGSGWNADVWVARRFSTEREAHDYWRMMGDQDRSQFKIVEHMFLNKVPQGPFDFSEADSDAECDRILAMSAEEIEAHVRAQGDDPAEIVRNHDEMVMRIRLTYEREVLAQKIKERHLLTSLHIFDREDGSWKVFGFRKNAKGFQASCENGIGSSITDALKNLDDRLIAGPIRARLEQE